MSHMEPETTTFVTPVAAARIVGRTPYEVDSLVQAGVIDAIEKDERLYVSQDGLHRFQGRRRLATARRWFGGGAR